jgi:hypothetical protein
MPFSPAEGTPSLRRATTPNVEWMHALIHSDLVGQALSASREFTTRTHQSCPSNIVRFSELGVVREKLDEPSPNPLPEGEGYEGTPESAYQPTSRALGTIDGGRKM